MPYFLGIGSTRVGPGLHPQYTRAWYAREAVGGPSNSTIRNTAQTSVEHSADEHVTQVREQSPMMCKSPMTRRRERNSHMERNDRTWKRTRNKKTKTFHKIHKFQKIQKFTSFQENQKITNFSIFFFSIFFEKFIEV